MPESVIDRLSRLAGEQGGFIRAVPPAANLPRQVRTGMPEKGVPWPPPGTVQPDRHAYLNRPKGRESGLI